ncbi:MurR/RpiR family transcriptional regulator [Vagococcus sp. DIV0080]|uniref:MurR/RpiR family transcriptional regulator n=1 Tax=Candidatus Vagococcus giribetii TaxID=2230876 RepID=A0ABS3HT64_9ENTE|nr:MurR/RpiR family transcriptional regulator [Vagococcus sp. DIV0080]MBO0476031.1 MurR/RpiR family transcriptional regulator [Vagococcus sp. DIV0080]
MTILKQLANLKDVTPSEEVLIAYINQHRKEVLMMTPQSLSEASFVSVATVYRLLGKLGISSFSDLKVALAYTITNQHTSVDPNYPVDLEDNLQTSVAKMTSLYQQTLEETISLLSEEALKSSVELLLQAETIDIYAASANLHFARNFKFQLQEIGTLVNVPDEDYVQRLSAANSTKDHVAIVVSYGGRGQTTQEVVKLLTKNQTPIILVTSTQNNPLVSEAREVLFLASDENHYNKISSFSTRFSLLMLFDLLYTGYFNHNGEENRRFKLTNYQKMNQQLK